MTPRERVEWEKRKTEQEKNGMEVEWKVYNEIETEQSFVKT